MLNQRYVENINRSISELMQTDERVYIIGEDILDPYGGAFKATKGLSTLYPERVLTTPISEAGFTGLAIGLAMKGARPIVEIMFGDFSTLIIDQIMNHAVKFHWMFNGQVRVPIIVRTPMGGRRGYGPTHSQSLDPIFFGIPQLNIVAPSNLHLPGELLVKSVEHLNDPLLFIENKSLYSSRLLRPDSNNMIENYHYSEIKEYSKIYPTVHLTISPFDKPDVTLIAYGGMAPLAIEAGSKVFFEDEILVDVLIPSSIKPVPFLDFVDSVKKTGRVVIAEESPVCGGWGSEVASQIYETEFYLLKKPIERVGAKELPVPSARPLEDQVLPQVNDLIESIRKVLKV